MAVCSGRVFEEVVEIAADGARGKEADGEFGVLVDGRRGRQQAQLNFACHGDVAFELLFLALDGLVEARVFDGDGDLRGHRGERAHVVVVEECGARVLKIEHADHALFVEERNHELGARLCIHGQIALVLAHVGDVDGSPLAHGRADQAAGDGDAAHGGLRVAEPPGVPGDERVALLIEQHDGEHLVVDEASQQLAHLREQRIEIENRSQFGGDFVEDGQGFCLAGNAGVEARVFDCLRDARCRQREQVKVLGLEEVGLLAFEIQDADEAVLGNERNGELRTDVGVGGDVVFDFGDVVDEHGLAGEGDLADDAFAKRKAHAGGFGCVADLEAHAQVVGAVVEQEDGEDAVRDDRADQLGGAIEKGLQVERGVERVGHVGEERQVGGFDTGVLGIDVGVRVFRIGGAVVAFILRLRPRNWWGGRHGELKSMIQEQGPGIRDVEGQEMALELKQSGGIATLIPRTINVREA